MSKGTAGSCDEQRGVIAAATRKDSGRGREVVIDDEVELLFDLVDCDNRRFPEVADWLNSAVPCHQRNACSSSTWLGTIEKAVIPKHMYRLTYLDKYKLVQTPSSGESKSRT